MRIKVRHDTTYAYGAPAQSALQLLRMTPRSCDGQFVRRWRVEIDADARLHKDEDAYGNITHTVFIEGPIQSVRVTVEGEVYTADTSGIVRGTVERLPAKLYLRDTALTAPSPALGDFARSVRASEGGDMLSALHRLMLEINRRMTFLVGATTVTTTADEAFAAGRGVCQDFAHIFIVAARCLGMPARYVSGYYLRTDSADQEAGHAWAEAHVPGLGWVGFDPSHGVCVCERHIRVAAGSDYLDAAPLRGIHIGGHDEIMSVSVRVEQGRAIVES